ncbi:MAG: N-acetyl-1-D-myo-inositol-2-amino-2-deoxy-alpha-D-glucopyranoside deacetylase [Kineosporiaceae bacterium]|nr:N-acetyl-1-D-myo-inositol-2-amino-2-deoxy-alpha-D-glucopyranoside deacetylase [Aeromicrobium sp.]
MTLNDRRMLLVHAHPDDETIGTGATMAKYVEDGAKVTLVTCTAGEEGEVLVPGLVHLASANEDGLGKHRVGELAEAMRILGVTDHRFLGGFGHFRDSGMKWGDDGHATAADNTRPDTFWHSDLTDAANILVEIIRTEKPQVVITYDQFGGYGHPDHVQAHRVTTYAVALAAAPSYRHDLGDAWDVPKVYWSAMSASRMAAGIRQLRESGDSTSFEGMDPDNLPPFAVPDSDLSSAIDGGEFVDRKMDALRAHATQVAVDGPFFALSNNIGSKVWGTEFYRLVKGRPGPAGPSGFEEDLFAGL